MTERKHFKKRVRARMAKTGERYSSARQQIVQQARPASELDPAYLRGITGMSNEAVEKKTGRDWNQWIAVLDASRADRMKHSEIARLVHEKYGVPGWWAQTVTVGYERVRGLRAVNEKADGFAISKSKTVGVPIAELFHVWEDPEARRLWLDAEFHVRKSTPEKSMRITWQDGRSHLDVYFYPKGDDKSQVSIQHTKLDDGKEAELYKGYWGEKLNRMKTVLEAGR